MKDWFFKWLESVYGHLYSLTMNIVYRRKTYLFVKGLDSLDMGYRKKIRRYWKQFGLKPDLNDYRFYRSRGVKDDARLIPANIWHSVIEPSCTRLDMVKAFEDKNYMDLILGMDIAPRTVVRCVDGLLLDSEFRQLSIESAVRKCSGQTELVVKPTVESGGGRGVTFIDGYLVNEGFLESCNRDFSGNYCVQLKVKQHEWFAQFNSTSTNSLRLVTFLGEEGFTPLSCFLRVGSPGSKVDNISSGGKLVQVDLNDGRLLNLALDKKVNRVSIEDVVPDGCKKTVPKWNHILETLETMHWRLAHFKIINWDVLLDERGDVRLLEYNLLDSSVDWHQVNIGPMFGDKTDSVISEILTCRK